MQNLYTKTLTDYQLAVLVQKAKTDGVGNFELTLSAAIDAYIDSIKASVSVDPSIKVHADAEAKLATMTTEEKQAFVEGK